MDNRMMQPMPYARRREDLPEACDTCNRDDRRDDRRGCDSSGNSLLRRLQELGLSITDTVMYLDAYPDCCEALRKYRCLVAERARLLEEYECKYGPMTQYGAARMTDDWDWITRPWPWEYENDDRGGCC